MAPVTPSEGSLMFPGRPGELAAEPDHARPKAADDDVGDREQPELRALRQDVDQDVEAQVIALADADGGAEEDEPAHQDDGEAARSRSARS
jgi:hypothetical protein